MAEHEKENSGPGQGKRRRGRKKGQSSGMAPRSIHRMRSHEASRAEAELEAPVVIPNHPLIPREKPQVIETNKDLDELLDHVRAVGRFAYDTEFIGELSYYPKLCLIQIATHERVALVDPLSKVDLHDIWELIADESIETYLHAAAQDLEPVGRLIGKPAANIFDTQVAAGFVGLSYPVGLGRLIEELLDLRLGKGLTFTHWDHRPLSDVHARYAADDVRYLPALRETLKQKLEVLGHTNWAADECRISAEASQHEREPDTLFRRVKGMHLLKPRKLAVLRELSQLREQAARDHDVPPRSLMKDAVLLDLARSPITSIEKLGKVPGLPRRVAQAYGEAIVTSTDEAMKLPKAELPTLPEFVKETPPDQVRIDALNALAGSLCYAQSVAPSLAVNRKDIAQLYFAHRKSRDATQCRIMQGWRKEMIGLPMFELLEGRMEMVLHWENQGLKAAKNTREP